MTYARRQRLSYIDWRMLAHGGIRREHIMTRFGVSRAQASADLAAFQATHPDALTYDRNAKQYVPAEEPYRPVTGWTPRRAKAWASAQRAGIEWAWG